MSEYRLEDDEGGSGGGGGGEQGQEVGSLFFRKVVLYHQPFSLISEIHGSIEIRLLLGLLAATKKENEALNVYLLAVIREEFRAFDRNCKEWRSAMISRLRKTNAAYLASLWCDDDIVDSVKVKIIDKARLDKKKELLVYAGKRADGGGFLVRHLIARLNMAFAYCIGDMESKLHWKGELYSEIGKISTFWPRVKEKKALEHAWGNHLDCQVSLTNFAVESAWDAFDAEILRCESHARNFGALLDEVYE